MREPLNSRKVTRGFVLLTAVFFLLVGGLSWQVHVNRGLARKGQQAHDALCVIKGNLKRRVDDGQKLLDNNPGEDPIHEFGLSLPRDQVKSSVGYQRKDLNALIRYVDCVPPPKPKGHE